LQVKYLDQHGMDRAFWFPCSCVVTHTVVEFSIRSPNSGALGDSGAWEREGGFCPNLLRRYWLLC